MVQQINHGPELLIEEVDEFNLLYASTSNIEFDICKYLQDCLKNKQANLNKIKKRLISQYPFDDKRYYEQIKIAEEAFRYLEEIKGSGTDIKSLNLPVI